MNKLNKQNRDSSRESRRTAMGVGARGWRDRAKRKKDS